MNESLNETAYLMISPAIAHRLNEAVEELRDGGGEIHDLIDPGDRSEGQPATQHRAEVRLRYLKFAF